MKQFRIIYLAVIGAIVVGALFGASSASAITLCKVQESPCASKNLVTTIHFVNAPGSVFKLENSLASILCLNVLQQAEVTKTTEEQQELKVTSLTFSGCGTGGSHSNCSLEFEGGQAHTGIHLPYLWLLLWLDGFTSAQCTVLGFMKIDCTFDETTTKSAMVESALEHEGTGNGMVTINSPVSSSGGKLCPKEASTEVLLEPLEHVYTSK